MTIDREPPIARWEHNVAAARKHPFFSRRGPVRSVADASGEYARVVHTLYAGCLGDVAIDLWVGTDSANAERGLAPHEIAPWGTHGGVSTFLDAIADTAFHMGPVPVLWTRETLALANASDLPEHQPEAHIAPFPHLYFCGEGLTPTGLWFHEDGPGWVMAVSVNPETGVVQHRSTSLAHHYPEGYDEFWTGVFKKLAFMQSRYVDLRPEGHRRDQLGRARKRGADMADESMFVVRLRAPQPQASKGSGLATEHSHRWVVRGHYRRQWHPSLNAHRVRWIGAHVKGPADKPLADRLYAVVR